MNYHSSRKASAHHSSMISYRSIRKAAAHHSSLITYHSALAFMLIAYAIAATPVHAQWNTDVDGIDAGPVILRPSVEAAGAYDNRVLRAAGGGDAKGDYYADTAAALELVNWPSVYDVRAFGRFGYRSYLDYPNLNDDFYTLAASISTDHQPLIWGATADYSKSLDYNVTYNPAAGQTPDDILTDQARTTLSAGANAAYDSRRFNKTALVPGYSFRYRNTDYQGTQEADEAVFHTANLRLRYRYSPKSALYGGAVYSLQTWDDDEGNIGTLGVGMTHQMTDKTSWLAELGYSYAKYDLSGEDQGVVSNIRGNWQARPRITTYLFGGNSFQPGYSGSAARMVYRLGYGAAWQITKKYRLSGSILHDYQEPIGNGNTNDPAYNTLRNFFDLRAQYNPIDRLALVAGLRINDDQYEPVQSIISLKAVYQFY